MKIAVLLSVLFALGPCRPSFAQVVRPFAPPPALSAPPPEPSRFAPPPALSAPPPEPSRFAPPVTVPLFPADDGVVRRLERIEARLSAMESKLDESLRRAPR